MDEIDTQTVEGLGRPLPIKLSRIEPFEGQPRRYFDPKSVEVLANNIETEGQKTPVKVCKHATRSGIFVLIGGERRWRAFHKIQERSGKEPTVLAFVDIVRDHRHHFREALTDNLHREDIVPLDEAAAFHGLHHGDGMSVVDIATMVGKSVTYVEGRMRLHTLPDGVKLLMDPELPPNEQLGVTIAIEIARSTKDQGLRMELALEIIERQLGVLETRSFLTARTGYSSYHTSGSDNSYNGGRPRKPHDNYRIWERFLENTLREFDLKVKDLQVTTVYDSRPSEELDRHRDVRIIDQLVERLQKLRPLIAETSKQRFKRTGSI